jgi:uncharacterized repeat protein (TIGR01451 family)/fimbrial isopeptide formation D2 family protein
VPNSLTRNGVPVSSPTLTFPSEGTVDATGGEVTIVYTFDAVIDSIASSPQEEQINSSTIEWNIAPGGPAGTPQNAEVGVFVTDSSITVEKQQRNFTTGVPASFTTAPVDVSVGDVVYYQFTATNPSSNTIYNVSIDDVLSPYLQFNGSVTPPAAGIITHTGGTVNWSIDSIPASTSYSAVFAVTVLPGAAAQSTIENTTSATFTATATSPVVVYGPTTFNTVDLVLPSLLLEKSVSNETVRVGEIITYTLTLTVPAGTIAYNAVVSDTLPSQQLYMGSATRNGVPVLPAQTGQTITFNTESVIDATAGEVVIVYTFNARPTVGSNTSPYTQVQQNNATVNYDIDTEGTPVVSSTAQQDITVSRPFVELLKEQRTVTGGTGFTANDISVLAGDVVQFRLTATNSGSSEAYQVVLTDVLGDFLQYNGVVSSTNGTVVYDSGTKTLTWTLDTIAADSAETLVFAAQILPGISAGDTNSNLASALYDSDPQTPIEFGPTVSNTVQQIYPNVQITKSADPVNASVGDIITYTVHFLLPNGTVAYNAQFTDVIPIGQTYHNNATLEGVPIVPEQVSGQFVAFPLVPFADATGGALDFTYQFETVVVSANVDPVTLTETQTNEARGHWYLDPETPAPPVDDTADVIVTNSGITVGKEQRNVTTGGSFTADPINAFQDQIVEFALTVTNSGPNTVYDVILSDVLSANLAFVSGVSVPSGTVTHSGESAGGTVTWTVPSMNAGESLTAVFSVRVLVGTLTTIENYASSSFRIAPDNPTRYGTTQVTNTTEIDVLPPLSFVKTTSKSTATIGDTITYTLTVEIPSGVSAYDVQVIDTLTPEQQYVPGSWSPGTPTVTGTEISYTEPTSPLTGPMTLVYTFDAVVISANLQAPYSQIQRNKAEVLWNIEPSGPAAPPVSDFAEVTVLVPHLTSLKEQRNVTQGGAFTTAPLLGVETDDVVEYRITLTNDGAGTAYNVVTSDPLDPSLTFTSVVAPPPGTVVSSVPLGDPDGTITWTEATLAAGASVTLTFSVLVNAGPAPGTGVFNQTSSLYDTAAQNPTTLGPVLSNQVGFNYSNPVMVKTVAPQNVFVGDTITYTVAFTIPDGNVAYDVQVTDLLPAGQSYVPNTLTRNGVPLLSSPTLTFPNEGTVDATAGAVTVTYTFDAAVDSIAVSPHEEQVNTATLNWNIAQGGPAGAPQTGTVTVNATDSDIVLSKAQRNFTTGIPAAFTTEQISVSVGDVIYYELSVTNPSELYPVYNVSAEDELSTLLRFDGLTAPPDSGVIVHSGESAGGTVRWRINSIPPLTTYKAVFAVTVLAGGGAQSTIPNNFNAVFTADDVEPLILYGPRVSTTVLAQLPPLQFEKTATEQTAGIGDTIHYRLTVTIPNGVSAYDVQVIDTLTPEQQYVSGSWWPGTPTVTGTEISYTEPVSPLTGPMTLVYTFDAVVVSGNLQAPYTQIQRNKAEVLWNIEPSGPAAPPVSDFAEVTVLAPRLTSLKEQRNVTQGGAFTTAPLLGVETDDVVEYRITLTNDGAGTAYNVVTSDPLDPSLTFTSVVAPPPGTVVSSVPLGDPDGTVTWTEATLAAGASVALTFSVLVNAGPAPGSGVFNQASSLYDTAAQNPTTLDPAVSNQVGFNYSNPVMVKTVAPQNVFVGDTVTYTVAFTIPDGNIAYDVQVTDLLPARQSYVPNSLTRNGVPLLSSPTLTFPNEGTVDATAGAVTVTYTFDAVVDSIAVSPLEEQVNSATLNWNIASGGPAGAPQTDTTTVYATDSDIILSKAQRNFTTGIPEEFTTEPISASVGNVLYYELSVTNPSELYSVYNVSAEDELSTLLQYDGLTAPPEAGVVIHSGESAGGTVRWRINSIPPMTTYKAVFAVTVLADNTQSTIPNNFNAVFTADDVEPLILYGPRVSNTVLAEKVPPFLELTKSVSSDVVLPGQVITYTMELIIPKGTIAYYPQLSDEIPVGQSYDGNAARNGVPVVPTVTEQTLTFQEERILDARNESIRITYTFDAKIDSLPPQNEIQTNQATVNWATDPQGTPGTPAQASVEVHVQSPNLIIEKEQRNATCGGTFTKDDIAVRECDSIEYRITVNNTGSAPAYNVVIQDILSQFNFFLRTNEISSGDARFIAFGNFVKWTLESIDAGAKKVLTFTVEAVCGTPAHAQTENFASVIYAADPETTVQIGPVSSNIVVQKYANLHLAMCCNSRCIRPWHIVTVHAAVAVMPGTAAYDVKFSGILPCGLQFAGNAKDRVQ